MTSLFRGCSEAAPGLRRRVLAGPRAGRLGVSARFRAKGVGAVGDIGGDPAPSRQQQAAIAIGIEAIVVGNGMGIGCLHDIEPHQRADQHEQG